MMETRLSKVKKNIVWGMILNIISFFFPFIIRRMLLNKFGADYLGVHSLCTSIIGTLSAVDLGIDSALMHHLYKPIAENNIKRINQLLSFYQKVYFGIGIFFFSAGLLLLPFLNFFASHGVPKNLNIYIVFFLYILSTVPTYLLIVPKVMIINGHQDNYVISKALIIQYIFMYGFQMLFIYMRNFYLYAAVQMVMVSLMTFVLSGYIKHHYIGIHFSSKDKIEADFFRQALKETISVGIYKIRNTYRNSIDIIVLSTALGLTISAYYQNYFTILCAALLMSEIIGKSITASMGDLNAVGDEDGFRNIYKIILVGQMFVSGICAVIFLSLIQDFMIIWMGTETLLPNSSIIALAIYIYILGLSTVFMIIRNATGFWEKGRNVAIVETALNIFLDIILVIFWKTTGIIMATIISMLVIYIPFEIKYLSKYVLNMNMGETLKILVKSTAWFIISMITVFICCKFVPKIHFWQLIIKPTIGIFIAVLFWIIIYYHDVQFREIKKIIQGTVKDITKKFYRELKN